MIKAAHFHRSTGLMAIGAGLALSMTAFTGVASAQPEHDSHSYRTTDSHYLSAEDIDAMIPSREELAAMIPSQAELAAMIPSEAELREMIPSQAEMRAMIPDHAALVADARAGAVEGLREARAEIASEDDMPSDIRANVLASLDAQIAQLSH